MTVFAVTTAGRAVEKRKFSTSASMDGLNGVPLSASFSLLLAYSVSIAHMEVDSKIRLSTTLG